MLLDPSRSVLVLIDYQARLMPVIHEGERALDCAVVLGGVARELGVPIVGTEQNPRLLGANDARVAELCAHTLPKSHFGAVGDGLIERLAQWAPGADQFVLAGCETHVCLLQTALGLRQAGMATFVVPQACGSRRAEDKALALQRLAQAGVSLLSPEMVAFEWMRTCAHPSFKSVLKQIKAQPLL